MGDFISRRLPASFIHVWDLWLQNGIAASRTQLGDRWLDLYLTGPIWRFALMPGIFSGTSDTWAGVLMPSVDKVGRYFPLTIAMRVEPRPGAVFAVFSADSWYASLERIALTTLNIAALPDDLDRNLLSNPFPVPVPANQGSDTKELAAWWQEGKGNPKTFLLPAGHSLPDFFNTTAKDHFASTGSGKSFWWAVSPEAGPTRLRCFAGLPADSYFGTMLEENFTWQE